MFAIITSGRPRFRTLVFVLLAVELVDELVFGARNAAWPMIRGDLHLTYEQVGLLLSLPTIVAALIEPAIGVLGDTPRRRALLLGGGVAFTASIALAAVAPTWIVLLIAFAALSPASGAFVMLSQATLMDLSGDRHEQDMARWVVAGSIGVAAGTGLVGAVVHLGQSWRTAFVVLAVIAGIAVTAVARAGAAAVFVHDDATRGTRSRGIVLRELAVGFHGALRALRRSDVRRWLALLQCADFMMDLLGSFLALYLVDVAHATSIQAVLGVALFTGVGLGGDALLLPLLERVDGVRYLRASVGLAIIVFPLLLIAPTVPLKLAAIVMLALLNSGWYSIPQARLYASMPGQSGTVMTLANTFGLVGAAIPVLLGAIATRIGLGSAMWVLLVGPVVLFVGLPRTTRDLSH